jgi:penicillin amidase
MTDARRLVLVSLVALPLFASAAALSGSNTRAPEAVGFSALAHQSIAQYDGTLKVAGLKQDVEVVRDEWGVPHIYAKNIDDLFMVQGFVIAQDRLWQMELGRRLAEGRLSELVGADGVAHDRLYRLFKFRGPWTDAEWTNYHPEGRRIFEAYARGVNAFIAAAGDNLPVEFRLTGIRPEPWKPEEILVRNRVVMAVQEARREIRLAQSAAKYGIEEANRRAHPEPYGDLVAPEGVDLSLITDDVAKALEGDRYGTFPKPELLPRFRNWPNTKPSGDRGMPETSPGSNNFAIRGLLTATGKAFMVDDPHREVTMPALRYIVHLNAPGWNVAGATEPGLPGVIRGHNERIAWGRTASDADEADIYVEQVNPADPNQVKWNGSWERLQIVKETINVRGAAPHTLTVKIGRHGPIFYEDAAHHIAYALKTSMMSVGTAEYLGALRLDQATSAQECLTDSRYLRAPATNLVCADVDGNIAFRVSAAVPRRSGWNGRLPVSGTGKYEWGAFRDDLPEEYNPARGWIATANNNVQPAGFKEPIFFSSQGPFRRYDRIASLLRSGRSFTRDAVRAIILDIHNTEAEELIPWFRGWSGSTADVERARALVAGWDADMHKESAAAAVYFVWRRAVALDQLNAADATTRQALIDAGLHEAVAELARTQGVDVGSWRWGAINKSTFPHPLIAAYDLPSVERDGGGGTVHAIGSVYQLITDFSNLDDSLVTIAPGESGQPGSPYYGNLIDGWSRRDAFALAFSRAAVDAHAKHRLVLASSALPSR